MEYRIKQRIGFYLLLTSIAVIFIIFPYFWRKDEVKDIRDHSKYALAEIVRLSSTLKSGNYWHYRFRYDGIEYVNSQSTHIDYNINLGDHVLVNFSSINPKHNKLLYDYKLKPPFLNYLDSSWSTIPNKILYSGRKK